MPKSQPLLIGAARARAAERSSTGATSTLIVTVSVEGPATAAHTRHRWTVTSLFVQLR